MRKALLVIATLGRDCDNPCFLEQPKLTKVRLRPLSSTILIAYLPWSLLAPAARTVVSYALPLSRQAGDDPKSGRRMEAGDLCPAKGNVTSSSFPFFAYAGYIEVLLAC